MNLALFDFDGTLSEKDSLDEFLKYSVGRKKYLLNMFKFMPYFIFWQTKLMNNGVAKEHLFRIFFKGTDEKHFRKIAESFSLTKLDTMMRKDRMTILKKHQKNGDRVVIVSASMKCWLKPWCDKNKLELLSTQLEFKDEKFTGRFLTKNCHGAEKESRIRELLHVEEYESVYAYGDSSGDTEMLAMADKAVRY